MALKDFWNGVDCNIVESLPNPDEGRQKYRMVEKLLVSMFSKVIDPDTIINAFLDNNDMLIIRALKEYGITEMEFMEFTRLIGEAKDPSTRENNSFADAQNLVLTMFRKKVETLVSREKLKKEAVRAAITTFSQSTLIYGKGILINTFPFNNVSHLRLDKDDVESAVSGTIKKSEENCKKILVGRPVRYFNGGDVFIGPRQAPLGGRSR